MKRSPARHRYILTSRQQAGYTLVELMIALTISLFVLGAVASIYSNMKRTFIAQDDSAQLQDSQRLVITMLSTTIQSSGYFPDPVLSTASSALPPAGDFAAAQAITGTGDGSGSGVNSDTIEVRYQTSSGDGLMNCQGGSNTSGGPAISSNRFSINAANELTCTIGTLAVAIAGDVGKMSILYGVDTDANGSMDTYMPASIMTAAWWKGVYTAEISLSFLDRSASRPGAPVLMPKVMVHTINLMNRQ